MNDHSLGRFRNARPIAAGGDWIGARKRQEDAHASAYVGSPGTGSELFCIVCDGMGGHVGGQVASRLAVEAALDSIRAPRRPEIPGRLRDALAAANHAVGTRVRAEPDLEGMGSTFVAVLLREGKVHWISVGDSPLYMISHQGLQRLNADHSLRTQLEEQARRGEITAEAARNNPNRNALVSAVMGEEISLYDLNQIDASPVSRIIMATDGIETLANDEIGRIATRHLSAPPSALQNALIEAVKAHDKPHQDNTTVVVIDPLPKAVAVAAVAPSRFQMTTPVYAALAAVTVLLVLLIWLLVSMLTGDDGTAPEEAAAATGAGGECKLETTDPQQPNNLEDLCRCVAANGDGNVVIWGSLPFDLEPITKHCMDSGGELPPNIDELTSTSGGSSNNGGNSGNTGDADTQGGDGGVAPRGSDGGGEEPSVSASGTDADGATGSGQELKPGDEVDPDGKPVDHGRNVEIEQEDSNQPKSEQTVPQAGSGN